MQRVDRLRRSHNKPPVDACLLCSICADLVIDEPVNRPDHGVSLHFRRRALDRNAM